MPITRKLRIDIGTEMTVRVRDDRRQPVEGAVVSTETKSTRTDDHGLCTLQFGAPGFWKLTAAKSPTNRVAYTPASTLVRVVPNAAALRPYRPIGSR
ncbi:MULTISPECIES: hypothetical protein [unclassified Natrinema]|uniref:hypothetical protein n=1 Tax=unclassified Natrinema TaxID=2622230 RepID=UPI00026D4A35|nr:MULTISPECIES: hypothetical protein [unclassified Natrinema]AFO55707.1 hypothetical protein NJ7G_0453 [Natrinema sp. J7-2]